MYNKYNMLEVKNKSFFEKIIFYIKEMLKL